ncbi:unnamed protein product [Candidula unifasciata]|uniref:Uncharacterized protein n=1 Tax=Candidula unifasciata TaxID=100452 RepID=A0A8S3ZB07_9EUPU|nr:unnamed protein product [Candidula unifasciata]
MDTAIRPLLPAFELLWNAARSESKKYNINDAVNANFGKPQQNHGKQLHNHFANCTDLKSKKQPTENGYKNGTVHELNLEDHNGEGICNGSVADTEESVVVCTLECDHGDKYVRQIIHDGTTRSEWSRAEDVFVDWLNSDLTAQHAQRIDATIYFCRIPDSTSSDGIRLWAQNLQEEGKEVNIKIKVASLGPIVSRALDGLSNQNGHRKGRVHEIIGQCETEDTIRAVRRLTKLGAQVEPLSGGDWLQLIALLTDRASLQALDLKKSPCYEALSTALKMTS